MEIYIRDIDIRCIDPYVPFTAVLHELRSLISLLCQGTAHILSKIMILQVCSVIRNKCVAGCVGFVERITSKILHHGKKFIRFIRRNSFCHTSWNAAAFVTINEYRLLMLQLIRLLLAHIPADFIRLRNRITGKLHTNRHNLLLVNDSPVSIF